MDFDIKKMLETDDFEQIYKEARRVTAETKGNVIFARAIVEYSNYCARNCAYCGINRYSAEITRYRMTDREILESAQNAVNAGFKTVVLQGGEDLEFTADRLAEIVEKVAALGVTVTVSAGEMDYESYKKIKRAGAARYLLKHETADAQLYARLHKGYSLQSRVECIKNLRELGYEVGGGFIVGLPGQTIDTLVADVKLLCELRVDMAGISPFIPHSGTALGGLNVGNAELVKRCVAITRLLLPNCNLPITTAYAVSNGYDEGFASGAANVVMAKATPFKYRKLYEIYPNSAEMKSIEQSRRYLSALAAKYGKILE